MITVALDQETLNASEESVFVFDYDNKVDQAHGYYVFFGAIGSFLVLNWIVYKIGRPSVVTEDEWRWRNLLISWVHGMIVGSWDILSFVIFPELLDDLIHHINYFTYLMVAFSAGYFVYDFVDMGMQNKLIKHYEITLHHIAVASMFWYNFHCRMCIAYNVIALMAEINSFFLHSRKLLQMLKFRYDHWLYRVVITLNITTFFYCRGWSLTKISVGMYYDNHMVPSTYFYSLAFSMFVMNVVNPILFWRLLKNDFIKPLQANRTKGAKVNGNNNIATNHIKSN